MKNSIQYFLFLIIFLATSGLVLSQELVPLGTHNDFVDKFRNSKSLIGSAKVRIPVSATESLSLGLNVRKKSGPAEVFIGEIDNEKNASFFLSATSTEIEGNIVLVDKKIAYQFYSDLQGNPFVKQVDIHSVLCIDYNKQNAALDTNGIQLAPAAGSTAYTLQSLPGATAVALLDFDGQYVSGTRWNSGNPINASPSNFSETQVTEIWRMISEDYRPFNINITTDSNVFFAAPANRRQRCIFTPTNTAAPGSGGVAYLNSFSSGTDNDTPCWVFNSGVKSGGEAGSHELGHTFGLSHDGTSTEDYYTGHGYWAPIMGASYYDILGQWSKGEYPDANNQEDDLAIITKSANGVTYRADEAGNTIAAAKVLTIAASGTVTGSQNYGIITTRTDIDVYSFTTSGGTVNITVSPSTVHPDLNVLLKLTDAAGNVLVTADPTPAGTTNAALTASLAASISKSLTAGTYYLHVDGTGEGDLTTGYSDYACIGEYTVSGTIPVTGGSIPPTVSLTAPANNAVICSSGSITLTASASDADGTISKVEFFDGTVLLTTLTTSPYTFNWTNASAGAHTITAKATDNGNLGTTSSPVNITVNATPSAPTVTSSVSYCQNASASLLSATGTSLKWYTVSTGGTGSTTAPRPVTTTAGTFYYYVSQTVNGCESPRATITVTVNPIPADPLVTTPLTYCQNTSATALTATGSGLKWYTVATGGTASTTAPTPSTTTVGTTSRYVSQTVNGCESARAVISITVNAAPAAPGVSSPVNYCQNASASPLTATGTDLKWYSASTGGTASSNAPLPSTSAAGTTNYYVSQTSNGCESARALLTVTVNPIPSAPTVASPVNYCQNATATALTATGTNLKWYSTLTGGTPSTSASVPLTSSAGSTNYYVSQTSSNCESPRATIVVNVSLPPDAPAVSSPVNYCQNATASPLTATGTSLKWYTVSSGGTGSSTAPVPSTTNAGTSNFYVSQSIGGCESARAMISVTINSVPQPAVTSPVTYCQNATAVPLTATGSSLKWYSSTGGTGTATAPVPVTTTVGTTNYYVSQTTNGCESPKATISVTINAIPASPGVTSPVNYCQNTSAVPLTANGTALKWYTLSSGGTSSATAPVPGTTSAGSTNYYVSQTIAGCESARSTIAVTVSANPVANISASGPTTFCQGSSLTLNAGTGTSFVWRNGNTQVGTNSTYIANNSGSYTVEVSNAAGCKAVSSPLVITVNSLPGATVTAGGPLTFTEGGSVQLNANSGTGFNYRWFRGSSEVATGPTYTATATGDYHVEVTSPAGCTSVSGNTTVTVNPNQPPIVEITNPSQNASFVSPASITLTAIASDPDGTVTQVQFYYGNNLLNSDASTPYTYTLNNLSAGTYSITAVATDNFGASTTSPVITFTVFNTLPTVSITSPVNGNTFIENADLTIEATASDANGSIALVEFYHEGTLIGSDASGPFSVNWNNVAAGTYQLTAKAFDNEGGYASSSVVTITVNVNQPSVITINSPVNNTSTSGTSITIDASVTDPDGDILLVEYLDGNSVIGTSTTEPFTLIVENISEGTHEISIRVTDSNGGVTISSTVNVTVDRQTAIHGFTGMEAFCKVYPNPTNTNVTIETIVSLESSSIKVYNAYGSEVTVPLSVSGTYANADLSSLTAGVYTLVINQKDSIIRTKIIVAR